jgi:uncharacterized protein YbjT (DUF2867 family)
MPDLKTILVTGATGRQGGVVARRLLDDGFSVRALVRSDADARARALVERGAQLVEADYQDATSLRRALDGVYGVFCVLPFVPVEQEHEVDMGRSLADAAVAAGVSHFVYSSGASANRNTGVPHLESKWRIEQHVRYVDLPFTILRPVAFNYSLWEWREPALKDGVMADPRRGNTPVPQVDENDFARLVSTALGDPGRWIDRTLDVASDELTVAEMADLFGRILDRPVDHLRIPWTQMRQTVGGEVNRLMRWTEETGARVDFKALRSEFPWLTPLETYLREHWTDHHRTGRPAPSTA